MKKLLLYSIVLLATTRFSKAQDKTPRPTDRSLQDFCAKNNGKYEENVKDFAGERCTVTFQLEAANEEQAKKFCVEWIPYNLASFVHEPKQITCVVEVISLCPSDYVTLYETCYKLISETKEYTRSEAESECKKENGELLKISRSNLIETLSIFFPLTSVWIELNMNYNDFYVKDQGTSLALVFESAALLHVPFLSMIKLHPTNDRAMVICQKESEKTLEYFDVSMENLKKIGFEGIVVDDVIYYPTINQHGRKSNLGDYDSACASSLRSLFEINYHTQSFVPRTNDLAKINGSSKQQPHLIRIGAQRPQRTGKSQVVCFTTMHPPDYLRTSFVLQTGFEFVSLGHGGLKEAFNPLETCDSQYSTAVVLGLGKNQIYETSDAFRAPLLCGTAPPLVVLKNRTREECRNGWTFFERPNNQGVCHKIFSRGRYRNWDEARRACQNDGATLSGFETQEEYNFFVKKLKGDRAWLGGQVKKECRSYEGAYDPNENAPCSKKNKFIWMNGAASNENLKIADHWHDIAPNNINNHEFCLEIWGWGDYPLNDFPCDIINPYFFCQYKVKIDIGSVA